MSELRKVAAQYVTRATGIVLGEDREDWSHGMFVVAIRDTAMEMLDGVRDGQPDTPPSADEMEWLVQEAGLDLGELARRSMSVYATSYSTVYERYVTAIAVLIDDILAYDDGFDRPKVAVAA